MSFIADIIAQIDIALLQKIDAVAHGLCAQKMLANDTIAPMKMSGGEMEYVIFDDNHETSFYHRAEQADFSQAGLGYSEPLITQVFHANLVLHSKVERCAHSILERILANLPRTFSHKVLEKIGLFKALIEPKSAELNAMNVFNAECRRADFRIPPENTLVSLKYEISLTFDKKCLTQNCTSNPPNPI